LCVCVCAKGLWMATHAPKRRRYLYLTLASFFL
jgi:predicted metal-binding protein